MVHLHAPRSVPVGSDREPSTPSFTFTRTPPRGIRRGPPSNARRRGAGRRSRPAWGLVGGHRRCRSMAASVAGSGHRRREGRPSEPRAVRSHGRLATHPVRIGERCGGGHLPKQTAACGRPDAGIDRRAPLAACLGRRRLTPCGLLRGIARYCRRFRAALMCCCTHHSA